MERKGVKLAVWDVNTQKLSLVYNPAVITLEKIQCRIADRGHDNDFELAKDAVYNALPACCRYRELNASPSTSETGENKESNNGSAELKIIKGVVLEENRQGSFVPLSGASVVWLGTNTGTVSDSSGVFSICQIKDANRLIISYTGYTPDTISTLNAKELKIILASGKQLNEVTVSAKQRSTYLSSLNPIAGARRC